MSRWDSRGYGKRLTARLVQFAHIGRHRNQRRGFEARWAGPLAARQGDHNETRCDHAGGLPLRAARVATEVPRPRRGLQKRDNKGGRLVSAMPTRHYFG